MQLHGTAKAGLDRLLRQTAGAQQDRLVKQAEDGGFHPNRAGAAVQYTFDPAVQPGVDVVCGGGADFARWVGRRRRQWAVKRGQQLMRQRMGRHPHGQCRQVSGHQRRQAAVFAQGQHQSQRTGPEGLRQLIRQIRPDDVTFRRLSIRNMHDQRVEAGASLGLKDPCYCQIIARICSQAIDCLRWHGDQPASVQQSGRTGHTSMIWGQMLGLKRAHWGAHDL